MAHRPKPYVSHRSFEMFKITTSEFGTVGMCRRMLTCTDEFLATVTEGVVHGVYKVVTGSSIGVARQHKVSGGKWMFHYYVTRSHMNLEL